METVSGDLSKPRVTLRKADGSVEAADFDIVVAADGAHSAVRRAVGIGFPGQALESSFYLADFRYAVPIDPSFAEISLFDPGMIGRLPVTRDVLRYISTLPDFGSQIQHPAPVAERVWASDFRIHFRHVARMAKGNVFLAGDAAHIHSPAGARGMNLGIEDACWLAWLISEGREREYAGLRMPAVKSGVEADPSADIAYYHEASGGDRDPQSCRPLAVANTCIPTKIASRRFRI